MNWGGYIFLSFVVFAIFIITLVVMTMQEDVNLVAEDYYQQEMKYQDQIDRIENTSQLEPIDLKANYTDQVVVLTFPETFLNKEIRGDIHFFRPSDSSLDHRVKLDLGEGLIQQVGMENLSKGLWRVKISWSDGEKEFYFEKVLVL